MIPTPTGLLVIALGIWCQFGDYRRTLVSTIVLTILEAANAANLVGLGGASVTPSKLFLLFLVLRIVSMRGGLGELVNAVAPRRVLFLYLLLLVWVIASGLLLPRLFQGAFDVFSLERSVIDSGAVPLKPSSGNITQSVYAIGSFVLAVSISVLSRKPGAYAALFTALMALTGADIAFAVIDLVTSATHTGFLLDVVHTGNYAFLTEDEASGLKRISGSFSEASAFASFSLDLLAVNLALFVMRVRPRLTGSFSVTLVAFLLLSTSSTAYFGLGVFGLAFTLYALWSLLVDGRARALKILFVLVTSSIFVICVAILLAPGLAEAAWHIIDTSVLQKSQSESAQERGELNTQAAAIFLDSYGLGAGVGATRTSNYILLLASNLGVPGLMLFGGLVLALTFARPRSNLSPDDTRMVSAARVGVLGSLVPATVIGTIFDLGPLFYVYVGIVASGTESFGARHRTAVRASTRAERLTLEAAR